MGCNLLLQEEIKDLLEFGAKSEEFSTFLGESLVTNIFNLTGSFSAVGPKTMLVENLLNLSTRNTIPSLLENNMCFRIAILMTFPKINDDSLESLVDFGLRSTRKISLFQSFPTALFVKINPTIKSGLGNFSISANLPNWRNTKQGLAHTITFLFVRIGHSNEKSRHTYMFAIRNCPIITGQHTLPSHPKIYKVFTPKIGLS